MADDGIIVVVNGIGIPILTRTHGQAQVPSNAAVGVVSAIFHAASASTKKMERFESTLYRVAFHMTEEGWMLALFESTAIPTWKSQHTLVMFDRLLHLILKPSLFTSDDSSVQKFELAKYTAIVDFALSHRRDLEWTLGMPLATPLDSVPCHNLGFAWNRDVCLVNDGVVVGIHEISSLLSWEWMLLIRLAHIIHEQPLKAWLQYSIYLRNKELAHQLTIVKVPSARRLLWIGISMDETHDGNVIASKLKDWCELANKTLPMPWSMPQFAHQICSSILGFCIYRQHPSASCQAIVGLQTSNFISDQFSPNKTNAPRSQKDVFDILSQYVEQEMHADEDALDNVFNLETTQIVHARRPPFEAMIVISNPVKFEDAIDIGNSVVREIFFC